VRLVDFGRFEGTVYSRACAEGRALAGLLRGADICIAVTGSLGRKDPANPDSKVGEVHLCVCRAGVAPYYMLLQVGEASRPEAKRLIAEAAFQLVLDAI